MRKIPTIALFLALIMIFTGCSLIQVNEERDMQRTVITVDGQEVTKAEYSNAYYNLLQTYVYFYGLSASDLDDPEYADMLQEGAINNTVDQKIMKIQAENYGLYDFTQEELDDIQAQYDDFIETYKQSSKTKIEDDEKNTELSREALDKLIEEDYMTTLEGLGFDEEIYMQSLKDQKATAKLQEIITETQDPTESEIQIAYSEKVETQKQSFLNGSSDYETLVSNDSSTMYYYLPDTRKARHILIGLPEDIQAQISQLRENEDDEGANLLLKEELAKIKDEANAVYALANEGAEFDELIAEYGEDPGMSEDNFYTVVKGSTKYAKEFSDGLFSLQNVGDFTQPISSNFGYHIILYAETVPEGAVAIDEVKEDIVQELLSSKQNELYTTQMEAWRDEMKIKVYKSRLNIDLG